MNRYQTKENVNRNELFNGLDFSTISDDPDFKEDSVREVIILPILRALGYRGGNIVRSKSLKHPYLKVGSAKEKPITLIPDYCLKVEGAFAWVLDAKSPRESVADSGNIEQAYSYASHPEIRSVYFALCNGIEFALYRREGTSEAVFSFYVEEIEHYWERLKEFLAPERFIVGKNIALDATPVKLRSKPGFDYSSRPMLDEIKVRKQAARRHYGVHGYFTKQAWNVVAQYIRNFSQPGDLVLDPYGGSGVTAIEALMNNRKAISIDINPFVIFLVNALIAPIDETEFTEAFEAVKKEYIQREPKTDKEIKSILKKYKYPQGIVLPKSSDVDTVEKLFSEKQLAQLTILRLIIRKQKNVNIKNTLLLMFSGIVTKNNLTYHTSTYVKKEGGGDAGAFRYYRYRIAPKPVKIDVIKFFDLRFQKVLAAKKEMQYYINEQTLPNIQVRKGTATDLSFLPKESVDYIYTDPPYGKKIQYLDLSIMWNAWLDLEVSDEDYRMEAIEGGERNKTKEEYNELIAKSIKEMYRVLKFDRWLSFVFAHKDPAFWHLIIESAESSGFEYVGAVPQKNGQTSFKKRQNPFTVLSGQLIINFRKVRKPKAILKANLGMDIAQIVMQTIEGIIAKNDGATLEQINDELIIKGLELGFLDLLKKEYKDLTPLLTNNFDYDEKSERFLIKKDGKFKTDVDVKLRIKYYLISFLRRMERENKIAKFDEIVLYIMPLLRNGATPEKQTILNVLELVAEKVGEDGWRILGDPQGELFK